MPEGAGGGDAAGDTCALGPEPCVTTTVAHRIQCPVIVALVVNLLGAILSFTCIPTSTKGASARAQAALPGKLHQTHPSRYTQVGPTRYIPLGLPCRTHLTGYTPPGMPLPDAWPE